MPWVLLDEAVENYGATLRGQGDSVVNGHSVVFTNENSGSQLYCNLDMPELNGAGGSVQIRVVLSGASATSYIRNSSPSSIQWVDEFGDDQYDNLFASGLEDFSRDLTVIYRSPDLDNLGEVAIFSGSDVLENFSGTFTFYIFEGAVPGDCFWTDVARAEQVCG